MMPQKMRDWFMRKRQAYRLTFGDGPSTKIVLADLANFCKARGNTTVVSMVTGCVDQAASDRLVGRREVWDRISQLLHMTDRDLHRIMENEQLQEQDFGTG